MQDSHHPCFHAGRHAPLIHGAFAETFAQHISAAEPTRQLFIKSIDGITNLKFAYDENGSILQRNIAVFTGDSTMTATTNFIAAALAAIRSFSQELYAAHGGWAPSVRG